MLSVTVVIDPPLMLMSEVASETGHIIGGWNGQGPSTEEIRQLTVRFSLPLSVEGGESGEHSGTNPANWRLYHNDVPVSDWIDHIEVEGEYATLVFDRPLPAGSYCVLGMTSLTSSGGIELKNFTAVESFSPLEELGTYSPLPFTVPEFVARGGDRPAISLENATLVDMAMRAEGDFVALFRKAPSPESYDDLYAQRYDAAGHPQGDPILVANSVSSIGSRIGIADDGGFVVSATIVTPIPPAHPSAPVEAFYSVVLRFDKDGHRLGNVIPVLPAQENVYILDLTVAENGRFAVVTQYGAVSYDAAGNQLGSFTITYGASAVLIDAQGILTIVHDDYFGGVLFRRFTSTGTQLGANEYLTPELGGIAKFFKTRGSRSLVASYWYGGENWLLPIQDDGTHGEAIRLQGSALDLEISSIADDGQGGYLLAGPRSGNIGYQSVSGDGTLGRAFSASVGGIPWDQADRAALVGASSAGNLTFLWNAQLPDFSYQAMLRQVHRDRPQAYVDLDTAMPGAGALGTMGPRANSKQLLDPDALRLASSDGTLDGVRIAINQRRPGDLLTVDARGTSVTPSYSNDVLVLSGHATVEDYHRVLKSLKFSSTSVRSVGAEVLVRIEIAHGASRYDTDLVLSATAGSVVQRQIFYNRSKYDGGNAAANAGDDAAIVTDKQALLPGQTATLANITSYAAGINGIMVDLAGVIGAITADDFIFRLGNDNDPAQWDEAPRPQAVVVRPGAGAGGSDRVEIIWKDGEVSNGWLQVTVLANGNTGLAEPDVFYFGNRVGDSGNEPHRAQPETKEALAIINRILSISGSLPQAAFDDPLDFNRDGKISSRDLLTVFNALLESRPPLELIEVPPVADAVAAPLVSISERGPIRPVAVLAAALAEWELEEDESQYGRLVEATALLMQEPDDLP